MWTKLTFGKHSGKTLPQVLLTDPDYFFWAMEQDDFFRGPLDHEAADLLSKARRIRIPKPDPEEWTVEHFLDPQGKYAHFDIVERDRAPHEGSSITVRAQLIDMRFVREVKHYDKIGYRGFMRSLKYFAFGSEKTRLTREKCEAFFDDDDNFDL